MYLNETCSGILVRKHWPDAFSIQNDLEQAGALSPLLFNLALEYAITNCKKSGQHWTGFGPTSCWPS
jgi:hypothetical protein